MPLVPCAKPQPEPTFFFGGLATCSGKMRITLAGLERAAATDLSLLIEGETGVGKELAAESVHLASARRARPFVVFDCAATSERTGERELFGTAEPGLAMPGSLEMATGGTILLDHIDELAIPLQARLLKSLECRQIRGASASSIALDVRFVAAATKALNREVRVRGFNHELFLQLRAVRVRIPPLRERVADLTLLSEALLAALEPPRTLRDIPDHVWAAFRVYHWPGNVRELKHALQCAVVMPDRALRFMRRR